MPNLVKQRFVVEKSNHTRVINSNEKMEQIIQKNSGGFTQGLFAPHVGVEESETDDVSGIEALLSDSFEGEFFENESDENETYENETYEGGDFSEFEQNEAGGYLLGQDERIQQEQEDFLEKYSQEAEQILKDARMQAQEIQDRAYQEGIERAESELQQLKEQLQQEYDNKEMELNQAIQMQLEEMEPRLVDTILEVVDSVLKVELVDSREVIYSLVHQTMMNFENPKEMQIQVSENNLSYMKEHLPELKSYLSDEMKIEVVRNSQLSDQDCRIETEYGIYDCGLDTQLENLKRRIKLLSRQGDEGVF